VATEEVLHCESATATQRANFLLKKLDEIITFLSRHAYSARRFSVCVITQKLKIISVRFGQLSLDGTEPSHHVAWFLETRACNMLAAESVSNDI